MKLYPFLNLFYTALAQDADLAAWGQATYGRPVQVAVAPPPDVLPGPEDCPYLLVHSPAKAASEMRREVEYGLRLTAVVHDEEDKDRGEENIQESAGHERLLALIDQALAIVRAAKPEDFFMEITIETETETYFPTLPAWIDILFREELVAGQDPLA